MARKHRRSSGGLDLGLSFDMGLNSMPSSRKHSSGAGFLDSMPSTPLDTEIGLGPRGRSGKKGPLDFEFSTNLDWDFGSGLERAARTKAHGSSGGAGASMAAFGGAMKSAGSIAGRVGSLAGSAARGLSARIEGKLGRSPKPSLRAGEDTRSNEELKREAVEKGKATRAMNEALEDVDDLDDVE